MDTSWLEFIMFLLILFSPAIAASAVIIGIIVIDIKDRRSRRKK